MPEVDATRLAEVLEHCVDALARGDSPAVAELCSGSPELLAAVQGRLDRMSEIDRALGLEPVEDDDIATHQPPGIGTVVGGYRLERWIGEGGFGVVFEAARTDGRLGRFAVKLLSRSVYSAAARARFENEGRALSIARHDSIASVIDAGISDHGVPFLVMNYIDGTPLTEFSAAHALNDAEKLHLFLEACAAVEHAHAKGVIHRDLKPGNILARSEDGRNKLTVIDFGIARVTDGAKVHGHRVTQDGEMIGTAVYMSPEQLGAIEADPDTRSDIYSLGVILYEMFSGRRPYQRTRDEAVSVYELQRRMHAGVPGPINSRMTDRHGTGSSSQASLPNSAMHASDLAGRELNWIVAKCLEVDLDRRYTTCRELSDDIRRLMRREPVSAGPQSRSYLARKFVQRHRLGVVTAVIVAAIVIAATTVTSYGLLRATRERTRALAAEAETQTVAEFQAAQLKLIDATAMGQAIRAEMLASLRTARAAIDPVQADVVLNAVILPDVATRVLQEAVFEPSLAAIDAEFIGKPGIRGRLIRSIGEAQIEIGLIAEGTQSHKTSSTLLHDQLGPEHPETLLAQREYANALGVLGEYEESLRLLKDVVRFQLMLFGRDDKQVLISRNDLGMAHFRTSRVDEAVSILTSVVEDSERALGSDHQQTATFRGNLGDALDSLGLYKESESQHRSSLKTLQTRYGSDHQASLLAMNNLAKSIAMQGRYDESLPVLDQAAARSTSVLGLQHPTTMLILSNRAIVLLNAERLDEALAANDELLGLRRSVHGESHPMVIVSMNTKAAILAKLERYSEAESVAEETVRQAVAAFGDDANETAVFRGVLASILSAQGEYEAAEPLLDRAHDVLFAALGPDSMYVKRNAQHAAQMYRIWDEQSPGQGHDIRAAYWETILGTAD